MTNREPNGEPNREPCGGLTHQTVVVIGASAGIGLETARQVRAQGARVVLVGRNPDRLRQASLELDPVSTAAFDATDTDRLKQFFDELPGPVDHVMVTAGAPFYMPLDGMDLADARREFDERLAMTLGVALYSRDKVRAGGTLLFMGGTGGRRPAVGMSVVAALTAAQPALIANLALELAPIRVNLIAAGFVDTPLSASLLGDRLDARREELRETLPVRRVVDPADVAALAVHVMCNDALTGATYDVDGGQQLLSR
ncbi:SDR family oxidoreductase [Streptomyces sp. NPDC005728]|uniref:SDR family oxidoreductase n=1 Tax=Streptomyces sp. NPDC005728 TaxID=3157054 RepID=UPI0033C7F49D